MTSSAGVYGWEPPSVEGAARLFPNYEVLTLLGRGGMGAVYKARQIELDRLVAIKLLPLEISVDRDFADRFRREARAMAKLHHPNIITVFDFGTTTEGHLFFAMEFVDGANLHTIIHGPGLEPAQTLAITAQVCEALAFAHEQGVVHRDIKPANVMLDQRGRVKVADFGLARLTDPTAAKIGETRTGMIMGTPDYMAPEQTKGMAVDHRADIYSLGVMLYEMLCKDVPRGFVDPPSIRAGVDARLDEVVKKAMQQFPERRYQQTTEMKADVDSIRTTLVTGASAQPTEVTLRRGDASGAPAKPARTGLWIGIGALVIGGAVFMLTRPTSPTGQTIEPSTPLPTPAASVATPTPATPPPPPPVPATPKPTPAPTAKPATPLPVQPSEVLTFAGHRYQLVPDAMTWNEAKAKAEVMGGHLATFITEEEELWARDHLIGPLKTDELRRYAVGGSGEENSIDYRWLNGASVGKLHWISGNPWWRQLLDTDEKKAPAGLYVVRLKDGEPSWIGVLPAIKSLAGFIIEWDDGKPDPAPAPVATPAPAPPVVAAATPKPQTEVEKWLAQVDATQQETFRQQVSEPFDAGVTDLRKQHTAALDAGIARATASKQLTEAIAWQNERKAFEETHAVTGTDTGLPSGVQSLRSAFRQRRAKLEQARAAKAMELYTAYDAILAQNQTALTQRQRLDDALVLKAKRDELSKTWLPLFAAAAPPSATPEVGSPSVRLSQPNQNSFALAAKERPFVNSLGMKFVPVKITGGPGSQQRVLFSIWETRVQDYEVFATETKRAWTKPTFEQGPTHPAVNVSWEDAQAFCNWLTERERRIGRMRATELYRLPTDHEWSSAIGSKQREDPKRKTPTDKSGKVQEFPWGLEWPPPRSAGNFSGEECKGIEAPGQSILPGYRDNFPTTAPVGSFTANKFGLFDLGGNVRELCEDLDESNVGQRILRGAGFLTYEKGPMWWSARAGHGEKSIGPSVGFRVVASDSSPAR